MPPVPPPAPSGPSAREGGALPVPSRLAVTWAVLKRELGAYFLSPITYILMALFLCVQGYSFFLVCQALTNQRASTAAVMQYFFGGTFVYWVFLTFLVAALTMRLVAEERQRGTIEPLLSAPVTEGAVAVGKYLAALACYCVLWLPTLAFPALLARHAALGDGARLDLGPIAGAYLGTLLCGGSALAVGLLCSALTRSQVLAAALSFSALTLLLLSGLLADLYLRDPAARAILQYVNQFQHLDELSRGIVDSRRLIYHGGLALAAVFLTGRVLRVRPGERRRALQTGLDAALCLVVLVGLNALTARRAQRYDLTAARQFTLSPRLLDLLSEVRRGPGAELLGFGLSAGSAEDPGGVADTTRELLQRASAATGGALRLELLDVDRDRERVRLLSERFKVPRDELRRGVVIVTSGASGARYKLITRDELAEFEPGANGEPPRLAAYQGETALATALVTVLRDKAPDLCFIRGHGEAAIDDLSGDGLSDLADAVRRDGMSARALDGATFTGCDAVVSAGPQRAFTPEEAAALARYLDGGGRLLLLLGPLLDPAVTRFAESGLEELLRARGVRPSQSVVVDPERRLGESPAFVVDDGYEAHPITERFPGRRTLWTLARPVRALPVPPLSDGAQWKAVEIVKAGERSFGETDLASLRESRAVAGDGDERGPVPLAVAAEAAGRPARLLVLGAARFGHNDTMALYNKDLVLAGLSWLLAQEQTVRIEPKRPEQLRLALADDQLTRLFLVTVVGMPLMALLLGLGVLWARRA